MLKKIALVANYFFFQIVGRKWRDRKFINASGSIGVSQVALVVKNPPANARRIRNIGSVPGLGRSHGRGHGNPLQYPCPENFMDRERSLAVYGPYYCKM